MTPELRIKEFAIFKYVWQYGKTLLMPKDARILVGGKEMRILEEVA